MPEAAASPSHDLSHTGANLSLDQAGNREWLHGSELKLSEAPLSSKARCLLIEGCGRSRAVQWQESAPAHLQPSHPLPTPAGPLFYLPRRGWGISGQKGASL